MPHSLPPVTEEGENKMKERKLEDIYVKLERHLNLYMNILNLRLFVPNTATFDRPESLEFFLVVFVAK